MTNTAFDVVLRPLRIITGLLAIMLAGSIIAGALFVASLRANDRAIVRARTEARHTQCLRDNHQADNATTYARTQAEVLVAASFRGRTPSDAEKQRADAYIADAVTSAHKLFPQRTCTRAAEDAYYRAGRR